MSLKTLSGVALLAGLFVLGSSAIAELVWDGELGWIDMEERLSSSDRGEYAYAKGLFIRGDYAAARDMFQKIEKTRPISVFAQQAIFGHARCEAHLGNLRKAVELYEYLLNQEQGAISSDNVLTYEIEVLGRLADSDPMTAAGLLKTTVSHPAREDLLAEAHFLMGEAYFKVGEYDQARASYLTASMMVEATRERKHEAIYGAALCDLAASREQGHDPSRLKRARDGFKAYISAVARGEQIETAEQYLEIIEELLKESNRACQKVLYAATGFLEKHENNYYGILKRGARSYRGTVVGEIARFYEAESVYTQRELWNAFEIYEKYLKEYPTTRRHQEVIERELAIGKLLMEKYPDQSSVVMERVIANTPSGKQSDDALFHLGRVWMSSGKFGDAWEAFQKLMENYPQSEWYNAALFYVALADLHKAKTSGDNEISLERAKDEFESYLLRDPNGAYSERALTLKHETVIFQALNAQKVMRFYMRRGKRRSAAWYGRLIVNEYPGTSQAKQAQDVLDSYARSGVILP